MAEKKGLLLGRYEVGKLLGQGNFAKVYHATNPTTKEEFAIKVLDKEKVFKSDLVVHVKREIAVLRRVRHPNIVRLYEMMATKSKIYFVMEFARGGELFNKVAKGRLQEDVARKYFQQLIGAVAFCHARGVFHRDIKPENLLLDENGDLKVSDFGLSAVADQIRLDGLSHTFCGTPAYLAPEVLLQKGYNPVKADIWSCGVVLFLLMAGYLPFNDRNVMGLYRKICNGEFRCPKWFSSGLVRLVNQMLETSPERRISIAEIMAKRWFKKDFQQIKFYVEGNEFQNFDDIDSPRSIEDESRSSSSEPSTPSTIKRSSSSSSLAGSEAKESGIRRMASLNAFDIISFSPGFDLSGLFEEREEETRFLSEAPVSMIVSKIEEIASLVSFTVRKKDCKVTLEGMKEGEKGPLRIAAEIFELTPTLVVVEFKKKSGDKMEYEDFCKKELKPRLQDLIHDASASAGNISSDSKVEE